MLTFDDLRKKISESPFNRNHYSANAPIRDLLKPEGGLKLYVDLKYQNSSPSELLETMTPEFQRESVNWSEAMKISFLENVIMKHRTVISLFSVRREQEECQVLDGLHRLHAFREFQEGKFKVFGNQFSYQDLVEGRILNGISPDLTLKIYTFRNIREAVEFYISFNENITHSPEEIEKAKRFLNFLISCKKVLKLKGIG